MIQVRGKVTDESSHYFGASGVKWLLLPQASLTDHGLVNVCRAKHLISLGLVGNPITDASVDALCGLTNLRILNIMDTGITEAGFNRLKNCLPKCKVINQPP